MNAREIRKLIHADDILANARPGRGGCWLWMGSRHNDGYAVLNSGGRQVKMHRASYLLNNGPIPQQRFVVHTCGNKACVNPEHLLLVDHKGLYQHNLEQDHVARGERNGFATLNANKVRRIRQLAKTGKYSHRQIGSLVGCHQTNVTRIVNRTYWAHVR